MNPTFPCRRRFDVRRRACRLLGRDVRIGRDAGRAGPPRPCAHRGRLDGDLHRDVRRQDGRTPPRRCAGVRGEAGRRGSLRHDDALHVDAHLVEVVECRRAHAHGERRGAEQVPVRAHHRHPSGDRFRQRSDGHERRAVELRHGRRGRDLRRPDVDVHQPERRHLLVRRSHRGHASPSRAKRTSRRSTGATAPTSRRTGGTSPRSAASR